MTTTTEVRPARVVATRWRWGAALFGLSAVAGVCGSLWWLFDLFAHFLPYQTVGLAVYVAGLWWKRDRVAAATATVMLIGCLWFIVPYYLPRSVPATGERISLRVCNVFCHNTEPHLSLIHI